MSDGTVEVGVISNMTSPVITVNSVTKPDGTTASSFSSAPLANSPYLISSTELQTQLFRVIQVTEEDDVNYTITALSYVENKYAFIEDGTALPTRTISILNQPASPPSNLTVTEATLKAATQSRSDNSTKVATTAYVDTAVGNLSSNSIADADNDTKIQVEESSDEDIIRADTGGQERVTIDNNVSMSSRGGFFTHNLTMHSSETFTIASTEGTVAAGPLDVQGTVDVQGSLVILW